MNEVDPVTRAVILLFEEGQDLAADEERRAAQEVVNCWREAHAPRSTSTAPIANKCC